MSDFLRRPIMKGYSNLNVFSKYCKKAVACCLILLLLLSGCSFNSKNKENGKNDNKNNSSNVDNNNEAGSNLNVDLLEGDISFEVSETTSKPRDDADEIRFSGYPAGLSNPLVGKYDKDAKKLRDEILNSKNTEEIYKITGTKYYISPGGDDNNDGKSPKTALRTIDALGNIDLEKGDAVLFERNSIFRLVQPLAASSGIIYGSYGEGEKPKLYASAMNFAQVEWKPSNRKNIWKTNYVYDSACSMVFNHGKEIGYLKTSVRNLTANTHFFQDEAGAVIYLYCDKGNPSKVYESIEISPDMDIINIPSYTSDITIDNLCLKYSGKIAIDAVYNNNNITVSNCEIGFTGGTNNGTVRYGNAIQAWTNSSNFVVRKNYIYQTFDTAITWQGQDTDDGRNIEYANCLFEGNLLEYNNADFEFWHTKGTVKNFIIQNNICRFTSLGWGTRADDGGYRGIEGFIFALTNNMIYKGKISVLNNIIDCPGRQFVNWTATAENIANHSVSGNKIFVNQSYKTTNEIMRNYDSGMLVANNLSELKDVVKKFDSSAVVEWTQK